MLIYQRVVDLSLLGLLQVIRLESKSEQMWFNHQKMCYIDNGNDDVPQLRIPEGYRYHIIIALQ